MIEKGAWKNRPMIIRDGRRTNSQDVRVEKVRQLGNALAIVKSNGNIIGTSDLLREIKEA